VLELTGLVTEFELYDDMRSAIESYEDPV